MSGDFQIGEWRVQPAANRLVRGGEVVRLEPKVMQVLVCLADQAGDVVTREQLIARVWSDVFVTDDVLHRAVRELRRVFGDRTEAPRYIETIRKRGYRLMVPTAAADELASGRDLAVEMQASAPRAQSAPLRSGPAVGAWPMTGLAVLLTIVCVGGVIGLALRDEGVTEAHPRFVPLVSGPANESDPALAPDGRRIAYVIRDSAADQADIYIQESPGAMPRRLTDDPADDRMPAWSPDGRRLAFIRLSGRGCAIVLRTLDTPDEQALGACGNVDEPRLAWLDPHTLLTAERPSDVHASGRLIRLSLTTGSRTAVSDPPAGIIGDHSPAVAPDGRTVAFIRRSSGGASDVYVIAATAGTSRRVTFDEADITGVTWTANGRALVYSSDRAGGYSLWRVPVEGGTPELLAGGAARLKHPVSGAGGRVAYESWQYEINVWRVGLVAQVGQGRQVGQAQPVIQTSELWNLYPQVSPDGELMAYVSTQSGSHELWVARVDGSGRRQLTDFGSEARAGVRGSAVRGPRWALDSRRLVFTAQRAGQVDVYTIDVRSGALQSVTADAAIEVAPAWSSDGRAVLYGRRDDDGWNIWSRSEGEEPVLVLRGGVGVQVVGEAIYYTRADRGGVWHWRGPDRDPDLIAADVPTGGTVNWQVTRDGVYTAASEGRTVILRHVPLTGGAPVRIAELPQYSWPGFSISPDGSSVFYARWDRRESNIMAVEGR